MSCRGDVSGRRPTGVQTAPTDEPLAEVDGVRSAPWRDSDTDSLQAAGKAGSNVQLEPEKA